MRILVVEDEKGIANFLQQGLEEEGYSIDIAYDGKEGLVLALSGVHDLLLLDWMLPEMSGIEICKQFRKHDQDVPIIFLTAKDTVDETIFGLQSGANDYIKKPFHFDELLERIKVHLRNKTNENTILKLGAIIINLETHEVHNNGDNIELTMKEFALLAYLVLNKGKVCRRKKNH